MAVGAWAQKPPLLPEKYVAALANELSGETAKRSLEGIARFHRQRGSQGFHAAAELIVERLRAYGLSDVAILQFPADGKIFYGTQRSRPAWDAEFAELRQITPEIEGEGGISPAGKTHWRADSMVWKERLLASYEAEPIVLAEDSESAVVTATIPGSDPKLKEEEIAFGCHLDHQRPGANDNASGCATILEVARTLQKLFDKRQLARPARTIRFVFPPEIEGTLALLNGRPDSIVGFCAPMTFSGTLEQFRAWQEANQGHPCQLVDDSEGGLKKRIKAVVHMDMVGGGPETKAVFHVTRGPMSLPSFVHDVAWAFGEWVNEESYQFAATG